MGFIGTQRTLLTSNNYCKKLLDYIFLIAMSDLKSYIRPTLLRFGVVLALSYAGFHYFRIRRRRAKSLLPPPSPPKASGMWCSSFTHTNHFRLYHATEMSFFSAFLGRHDGGYQNTFSAMSPRSNEQENVRLFLS